MRKIEKMMLDAVEEGNDLFHGNTNVIHDGEGRVHIYLHGSEIARYKDGKLSLTLAGWNTPTTRSRLSALVRHVYGSYARGVGTKQGQAFIAYQSHNRNIDDNEWVEV